MLGHGFWWTKFGLHVQAWKLHVEFGVLLSKGTQFPRSLSITQRCENRQETQVSTTIGHPEPHDLWGHRANIRHVLPLFTLSPRTLSDEKGSGPALSTQLFPPSSFRPSFLKRLLERSTPALHEPSPRAKGCSAFLLHRSRLSSLASHLLSSHPTLHGGELQLPAQLTKENSLQHKLYHPLSCNSTFSRRTSTSHWVAQLNRNQQGGFTQLRMAQQQLLFPLFKDVKTSGLNDLLGY